MYMYFTGIDFVSVHTNFLFDFATILEVLLFCLRPPVPHYIVMLLCHVRVTS